MKKKLFSFMIMFFLMSCKNNCILNNNNYIINDYIHESFNKKPCYTDEIKNVKIEFKIKNDLSCFGQESVLIINFDSSVVYCDKLTNSGYLDVPDLYFRKKFIPNIRIIYGNKKYKFANKVSFLIPDKTEFMVICFLKNNDISKPFDILDSSFNTISADPMW